MLGGGLWGRSALTVLGSALVAVGWSLAKSPYARALRRYRALGPGVYWPEVAPEAMAMERVPGLGQPVAVLVVGVALLVYGAFLGLNAFGLPALVLGLGVVAGAVRRLTVRRIVKQRVTYGRRGSGGAPH